MNSIIREKLHRLPGEFYRGTSIVAFTLCIKNREIVFDNPEFINIFITFLNELVRRYKCKIPVYCFMPDHLHLIVVGTDNEVDLLKVITAFKQKSGYWLAKNKPDISWQKDFFDHVIKKDESLLANVKYILDNPVRKGIVSDYQEYPFKGAIGYDLDDILNGLI
jgi:putative transposase